MRKQRLQPAFASLTDDQLNQVADRLRRGDSYEDVRQWVNQPAPEGFGLNISIRPLQTLWRRLSTLDLINARIPVDHRLTLRDLENIETASESSLAEEAHAAILETVRDLALSADHTPAHLLALQRLADFPERAALRAERATLQAAMHAHKIQMDLHRRQLTAERLELAKRRLQLAEARAKPVKNRNSSGALSAKILKELFELTTEPAPEPSPEQIEAIRPENLFGPASAHRTTVDAETPRAEYQPSPIFGAQQ